MNHIILYAEDYNWDVWETYCDICGVSYDATCIKIKFDPNDVEYETDYDSDDDCDDDDEDDDEEDYE